MSNIILTNQASKPINRIVSFIFICFCLEVILMGPGDWSSPLGFSVRKLLFVFIVLVFLTHFFCNKFRLADASLLVTGMGFFVIFGMLIPTLYDVDLNLSFADVRPLVGLLLIPCIVGFYNKSNRWAFDRRILAFALFLLAALHVALWLVGSTSRDLGESAITAMQNIYEPGIDVADSKIAINYTPDGFFRVQWGSSCLLLLALYFSTVQLLHRKSAYHILYLLVTCIALYTTQSRGLFLAVFLGIGHYVCFYYFVRLKRLNHLSYFGALFLILLFSMMILPFFAPEFLLSLGITREGSDNERFLQILPLMRNWLNHWFFGSGFGSGIEIIRSEVAPYAFEVSILSILMKIGILGTICSLMICATLLNQLFHGKVLPHQKQNLVLIFSMVFVYIIASNTNPYLSNFFGMLVFYCLSIELAEQNRI